MSLEFTKVATSSVTGSAAGSATCAVRTRTRIAVGFDSGYLRIYSNDDFVLQRELHLGKLITQLAVIPETELIAVICDQKCSVHDLDTRKLVANVDTRSARSVVGIRSWNSLNEGAIVVGSSYKLRILTFSNLRLTNTVVLDIPGRQKIRTLNSSHSDLSRTTHGTKEAPTVYILIGSKPTRIWRLDLTTTQLVPMAALDSEVFGNNASKFILTASPNYLFVGSSAGSQLLRISPLQILKSWKLAMVSSSCMLLSCPAGVSILAVDFSTNNGGVELNLINPASGNVLSKYSGVKLCGSNNSFGLNNHDILSIKCELTVDWIITMENKSEAATLARQLPPNYVTEQIREIERVEALRMFESGDRDEAMRLFLKIEEQEQRQKQEQEHTQSTNPNNHIFVLQVLTPYLDELTEQDPNSNPARKKLATPQRIDSSQNSIFSAKTVPNAKHYHPLDSVVAYLVFTRRKLRLEHYTGKSAADIDTALFRCYMLMNSPLVVPLLRSPNRCDPSIVKDQLLSRGKWRELVWFLRSRGQTEYHKEALDLLVQHNEPPESIIAYLEQLRSSDENSLQVAFEFSRPILVENPGLAYQLFFESHYIDSLKVYEFLNSIRAELAREFVRFRVLEFGDKTPSLHDNTALLLSESAADNTERQAELLKFLDTSQFINLEKLCGDSRIPAIGRAWLYRRLQNYEKAIDISVDEAQNLEAAQEIAETHHNTNYLFKKLLTSQSVDWLITFLNTVSTDTDIDFSNVLSKLPESMNVQRISQFLERSTATQLSQARTTEMQAAINRQNLSEHIIHLSELRRQKYIVDASTLCSVCHKRLGRAVTGVVNGELVHYVCLKLL